MVAIRGTLESGILTSASPTGVETMVYGGGGLLKASRRLGTKIHHFGFLSPCGGASWEE